MMSDPDELRLLLLSDMHADAVRMETAEGEPGYVNDLAAELTRRALEDAERRSLGRPDKSAPALDVVVLLGDLLHDGSGPLAESLLAEIREEIRAVAPQTPVVVVPGNHDGDAARLLAVFDDQPGLHEIFAGLASCRLVTFVDPYEQEKHCTRGEANRRMPADLASRDCPPIVAVQHYVVDPPVEADFPFNLSNCDHVMRDYARAGVLLSISGHYHDGHPPHVVDGVHYFTAPGLTKAPFQYSVVTLCGGTVSIETRSLSLHSGPRLTDCHCHTEMAYCGTTVSMAGDIERRELFGLGAICLIEHAPQLYCSAEKFWAAEHLHHPETWREGEHSRMETFLAQALPLRNSRTWIGLEVEADRDGALTLHAGDRDRVDVLLGAVHWLARDTDGLTAAELASVFMKTNEQVLGGGVDILAHPWRYLRRAAPAAPADLYADLADMLAGTNTAAEINFHAGTQPDVRFLRACIDRGVTIALGSDAHALHEVGNLGAHLHILRQAAGTDDVESLLWTPPGTP